MDKLQASQRTTSALTDRKNRLVAAMATQFKVLVELACSPPEDGATLEAAAAHSLRMEAETQTLVRTAEDILALTREMKEMWLFGPLRRLGEGEEEGPMNEDSEVTGNLVGELLKNARDLNMGVVPRAGDA